VHCGVCTRERQELYGGKTLRVTTEVSVVRRRRGRAKFVAGRAPGAAAAQPIVHCQRSFVVSVNTELREPRKPRLRLRDSRAASREIISAPARILGR